MSHARTPLAGLLLAALPALAATGPLAPELKALWTVEIAYHQERDRFSTDFQAIEFAPSGSVGMRVDSLATDRLIGLAWHDGMLRALRIDTLGPDIGPLGWSDTAAIPALRQILSNPAAIATQDTLLAGTRLHLWSRTADDTLWNLALDTASLQVFALRRIGTRWSTLGLDTLPRETLVATRALADAKVGLTESETWLQEQGTYPVSLTLDSARAALPLARLWQTSTVRDSALLLILDPQDASLAAWSSRTGLRGHSTLDRSVYAPAIRALFGDILTRKILPPATGNGWLSETDTLRSGDSSLVLELRTFRHGDTTLVTALERDGVSAFCRLQVPTGFLDFGFAPASVGVNATRRLAPARKPLRTDILGRPREGARLGTTTLRVRR